MCICLGTLPAFPQSGSEYQGGTITAVVPHQATGSDASVPSYDVSVIVGNTVYVVLYAPPAGQDIVKYVTGRELTVLVGEKTIKFNDLLGTTSEVPILSRRTREVQEGPASDSSPWQTPIKSTELVGLAGVRENTVGTLAVDGGKLHFVHAQGKSDIAAAAMEDVVTSDESQRVIRGTLGKLSMFGPYGSGRALSLLRSKIDTLTIEYRDADGGLHGVVFTMPEGSAESVKKELVAHGAHTRIATPANASLAAHSGNLEQNQ
jgi:hypothetical protein